MERKMTASTQNTDMLNTLKEAFAPVAEALKTLQNVEVPEAARDFVKRAAGAAKDRSADAEARAEKVTTAIESAVTGSVVETAKVSRTIQQALYQDAEAFFANVDKLAAAKSFGEAMQIQSDYLRARGDAAAARAKATAEYFGKLISDGAKSAQENFAKAASLSSKAA
jgi:phasin